MGLVFQKIIAPVIKQLNFKRQSSIKATAGKGFDDSATKCFRYFATGSIKERRFKVGTK
jgi:hypothetical protein